MLSLYKKQKQCQKEEAGAKRKIIIPSIGKFLGKERKATRKKSGAADTARARGHAEGARGRNRQSERKREVERITLSGHSIICRGELPPLSLLSAGRSFRLVLSLVMLSAHTSLDRWPPRDTHTTATRTQRRTCTGHTHGSVSCLVNRAASRACVNTCKTSVPPSLSRPHPFQLHRRPRLANCRKVITRRTACSTPTYPQRG